MTKRAGRSAANDPGLAALLDADADAITFVAKTWDYHVHVALGCTLAENIDGISQSIEAACAKGREAILDCEHFFDGYKANTDYALDCAKAAYAAGARWIVLCDTNGGTLPHEIERIVAEVARHIPGEQLGIHAHNDTENAVANSLAAIHAGVRHVQGTLNGLGERCGNANLVSLIPTLLLKRDYAETFEIGVAPAQLASLTKVSHTLDELLNRAPNRHQPYVGASAFATKAGIHASAVMKDPATYEHVVPESVGNQRRLLVSDQAGKSNILAELERIGVELAKDDPRLTRLLEEVKDKEAQGYAYEGADASFELWPGAASARCRIFSTSSVSASMSKSATMPPASSSPSRKPSSKCASMSTVLISAAEGNGPVNALDLALRKDLGKYHHFIAGSRTRRLSRPHISGRHRCGDPRAHRISRCVRRSLVDGRRLGQSDRRLLPGADRCDHL